MLCTAGDSEKVTFPPLTVYKLLQRLQRTDAQARARGRAQRSWFLLGTYERVGSSSSPQLTAHSLGADCTRTVVTDCRPAAGFNTRIKPGAVQSTAVAKIVFLPARVCNWLPGHILMELRLKASRWHGAQQGPWGIGCSFYCAESDGGSI